MIKEEQLSQLYKATAQLYGKREPNMAEFEVWKDLFSENFTFGDLDAALRRWNSDTSIEIFTQRPRGSRMPTPAELKASIEEFDRKQAQGVYFVPCGKDGCDGGWVRVETGKTIGGNVIKNSAVRRCQCFYQWAKERNAG